MHFDQSPKFFDILQKDHQLYCYFEIVEILTHFLTDKDSEELFFV